MKTKTREPVVSDDLPITKEQLPATALAFIQKYFSAIPITNITMNKELFSRTWEVLLQDDSIVEFSRDGDWDRIECKYSKVPAGIIPDDIRKYLNAFNKGSLVTGIERKRRGYVVNLDSGLELKFDADCNLTDADY